MRKKIVSILVIILFVLTIIVKIGASKNINNVTCTTESNKQQTMTEETDDVIEKTVTSDDDVPDISPLETAQSKDSQVNGNVTLKVTQLNWKCLIIQLPFIRCNNFFTISCSIIKCSKITNQIKSYICINL